jgi:hypothetical protein
MRKKSRVGPAVAGLLLLLGGVAPSAIPEDLRPTREYVYAGSRLLAVVEPYVRLPRLSVASSTVMEGPRALGPVSESGLVTFRVTLDEWRGPVTVRYRTEDETAVAGEDYEAASGTLAFDSALLLQRTIRVSLVDDDEAEGLESFRLVLEEPVGAEIETPVARAFIRDDDGGEVEP